MNIDHEYDFGYAMEAALECVRGWDEIELCRFLAECHPGEVVQVGGSIQRYDEKTGDAEVLA